MRKVTIDDISNETGLSRGTVSRALNDRADISKKTKLRVLDACKKLNYSPSSAARSLATGRNFAVSLLWRAPLTHYMSAFIHGCARSARAARYALTLIELPADAEGTDERIRSLSAERIDGAIVSVPLAGHEFELLAETVGERMLAAAFATPSVRCDAFYTDDAEAGALAARRLRRTSARTALFVARRGDSAAAMRHNGFRAEWSRSNDRDGAVQSIEVESGLELVEHESAFRTVDAVATSDDRLAVAALAMLARCDRSPARDVQLIGYGDEPCAADAILPLTTVAPDAFEAGARIAETLLQRLADERQDAPQSVAIAPQLVERSTVAAG